jgi:hypothetical protein
MNNLHLNAMIGAFGLALILPSLALAQSHPPPRQLISRIELRSPMFRPKIPIFRSCTRS